MEIQPGGSLSWIGGCAWPGCFGHREASLSVRAQVRLVKVEAWGSVDGRRRGSRIFLMTEGSLMKTPEGFDTTCDDCNRGADLNDLQGMIFVR
jgi:hypothetical protein